MYIYICIHYMANYILSSFMGLMIRQVDIYMYVYINVSVCVCVFMPK